MNYMIEKEHAADYLIIFRKSWKCSSKQCRYNQVLLQTGEYKIMVKIEGSLSQTLLGVGPVSAVLLASAYQPAVSEVQPTT